MHRQTLMICLSCYSHTRNPAMRRMRTTSLQGRCVIDDHCMMKASSSRQVALCPQIMEEGFTGTFPNSNVQMMFSLCGSMECIFWGVSLLNLEKWACHGPTQQLCSRAARLDPLGWIKHNIGVCFMGVCVVLRPGLTQVVCTPAIQLIA
jgi:hypothetical protein